MGFQLAAVAAIVGLAAAYLGRAAWRTWTGRKSGCGSACGKCGTPDSSGPEQQGRVPLPLA